MGKKKKSASDILFEENVKRPKKHERTDSSEKQFVRIFNNMLDNQNFMNLSGSAVKLLLYMKEFANKSNEYKHYGEFDYATSLSESKGFMAKKTCANALKELEHYGFIEKRNNAMSGCGFAQKWAFSDKWQKGTRPMFER